MALANHSDLLAAIASWLQRSDLTAQIPDFIALAEAEFRRQIRTLDMEARTTVTVTNGSGTLPSDNAGIREVILEDRKLEYLPYNQMNAMDQEQSGDALFWSVNDGDIYLFPAVSGTVTVIYQQTLPALTVSAPTNWLMTRNPDLYLFGCLMQAEFFGWNDERLPLIKTRVDEIIDQINTEAVKRKHGAVPLAPRIPGTVSVSRHIRA